MNYTTTELRTANLIKNFKRSSKFDTKRYNKAVEMLIADVNRENKDSGLYGKVFELFSHDEKSTIVRVQAQNRNDNYIFVDDIRKPCEVKTNGGRIGNLYAMSAKAQNANYIVYNLDFFVKAGKPRKDGTCKPAEYRKACKVMTVAQFIELVESVNAIKVIGHNDSDREVAVQADSKKLYKALVSGNYLDYTRGFHYLREDFE